LHKLRVLFLTSFQGWIHIKRDRTAYTNYYKKMKDGEADQWPPKFWKFQLETDDDPAVEIAFTDPRRLARVRLVECPGKDIRKHSPLVENGPDPVVDTDIFTGEFLGKKMKARHVPIKALLLDQKTLSGIGNWVGDEVLYQAKLHPEQYCDEFNDEQIKQLYESIRYVCQTAVEKLGDSDEFPEDWIFHHRWGKGKGASHMPNGDKLAFITVGGRTSCYAPEVQKKTGHIPPGVKEEPIVSDEEEPTKKKRTSKAKPKKEDVEEEDERPKKQKRASRTEPKEEEADEDDEPQTKKRKAEKGPVKTSRATNGKSTKVVRKQEDALESATNPGSHRRRSGRLSTR
jgi:formamidopyrimidine-DNA glycosylase